MQNTPLSLNTRPAKAADAPALCDLLNEIIRIGGTTAMEVPFSVAKFDEYFVSGPDVISCIVAEGAGIAYPLGFQVLMLYPELPQGWGDIGTFANRTHRVPGTGTTLFAATKRRAMELGLAAINATIRADNAGGLAYYTKMGFEDYQVTANVPLQDGTLVDRISKRYLITKAVDA